MLVSFGGGDLIIHSLRPCFFSIFFPSWIPTCSRYLAPCSSFASHTPPLSPIRLRLAADQVCWFPGPDNLSSAQVRTEATCGILIISFRNILLLFFFFFFLFFLFTLSLNHNFVGTVCHHQTSSPSRVSPTSTTPLVSYLDALCAFPTFKSQSHSPSAKSVLWYSVFTSIGPSRASRRLTRQKYYRPVSLDPVIVL